MTKPLKPGVITAPTCKSCNHYSPTSPSVGQCRLLPPVVVQLAPNYISVFPSVVGDTGWCSKHPQRSLRPRPTGPQVGIEVKKMFRG